MPRNAHPLQARPARLPAIEPTAALPRIAAARPRFAVDAARFDQALRDLLQLAARWQVELEPDLLGEPRCSLAVGGRRGAQRVVLKVPVDGEERTTGYRAARAFHGHGGVPVLDGDDATGALLMVRLDGPDLADLPDAAATDAWIELQARLAGAAADPGAAAPLQAFVTLPPEPPQGLDADTLAALANRLATLHATAPPGRLLHGDLHHFNVLQHAGDCYAIDPKGLWGDPHFEASAWLRNPFRTLLDCADPARVLAARIDRIVRATGLDAGRIRDWAQVQTCACAGPHDDWTRAMVRIVHALGEL